MRSSSSLVIRFDSSRYTLDSKFISIILVYLVLDFTCCSSASVFSNSVSKLRSRSCKLAIETISLLICCRSLVVLSLFSADSSNTL